MTKIKTVLEVIAIEAVIAGLILSAVAHGRHRYNQGYTNGLLDGAAESLNTVKNKTE